MFIPFGGGTPIRHKAFSDMNEVRKFICERPQHSCFYSTAYWKKPHELKMADKNWLGADLIFDLDGDHLPGVTCLLYTSPSPRDSDQSRMPSSA